MRMLMEQENKEPRQFFGFLREVISGQRITPPLFESMQILGKAVVLQRLYRAMNFIEDNLD